MKQEQERLIDGKKYIFYQFPAKTGVEVLLKLGKMLGEPLGLLGEQILQGKDTKKILDSDVKELAISKILDSLFKNLDVKETMTVIETLCKQVYFNGQPLSETFDVHFQADYVHLFKVIKTALEVQYGNFFQGIAGLQGLNAQATTQEPQT